MPSTTPVQSWPYPLETDAPDVAADMHSLALALDNVPKRLSGTAAARPVASGIPLDTIYYATDTGVFSVCSGAAWSTLPTITPAGVAGVLQLVTAQELMVTWGIASLSFAGTQFATPVTVTHGLPGSRIPKLVLTGGDGGPAISGSVGLNVQITNGVWNGSTFTLYGWGSVVQTNTLSIPWLVLG